MATQKIFNQFVLGLISLALLIVIFAFLSRADGKLHLVFCDVGQGDAILLIAPNGAQVLIDGGPDNRVLSCLGSKMPFWDRTIEMVVLTHPQADHLVGLIEVLKRYQVEKIVANNVVNQTSEYVAWQQRVKAEVVKEIRVKKGEVISFTNGLSAEIEWPIDGNYPLGVPADLNETSIIMRLNYRRFCALLTGDATASVLETLTALGDIKPCYLFKVPHHGSKNSLVESYWQQIKPQIAIISAGSQNRYGHPHSEILAELGKLESRVLRTDQRGTIEVITDGLKLKIK